MGIDGLRGMSGAWRGRIGRDKEGWEGVSMQVHPLPTQQIINDQFSYRLSESAKR